MLDGPTAETYTVEDLAERWRIHPASVYRYVQSGTLACLRFGPRTLRFTQEQVAAFEALSTIPARSATVPSNDPPDLTSVEPSREADPGDCRAGGCNCLEEPSETESEPEPGAEAPDIVPEELVPEPDVDDVPSWLSRDTLSLWPEAGRVIGCGRTWLYEEARAGRLPFVFKMGSKWRVSVPALAEWINSGGSGPRV